MKPIIAYTRVSTREQGLKRNGLEGQVADIERFAATEGTTIDTVFTEVVSGTYGLDGRPVLAQAIECARAMGLPLVVSKLDRFSRNSAFIGASIEAFKRSKVTFYVAELGTDTDPFLLHLYAALAEKERTMISVRTKAALAQVKAKGTVLGNRTNLAYAQALGGAANKAKGKLWAEGMRGIMQHMRGRGLSLRVMAEELNRYNTPTMRGGVWHAPTVNAVLKHLDI